MGTEVKSLIDVPLTQECVIFQVNANEKQKLRLFDLGFYRGSKVVPLYECHGGGTRVYGVKHTLIAIRSEEAKWILAEEAAYDSGKK